MIKLGWGCRGGDILDRNNRTRDKVFRAGKGREEAWRRQAKRKREAKKNTDEEREQEEEEMERYQELPEEPERNNDFTEAIGNIRERHT